MSKTNNNITDFIRNNTIERYKVYDDNNDGYCYSISLTFASAAMPEIKIALRETGVKNFERKFNEAVVQGKKLGAERIVIREFDDPELPIVTERSELKQEIPISVAKDKPATPRKKAAEGLGYAQVNELVQAGISNQQKELEIQKLRNDHDRALEKKDREIEKSQEILLKKQDELTAANTLISEHEKRIEELEEELEDAKENQWSLNRVPIGKVVGDMALTFLQKKPQLLSGLGIPAETVKAMFGNGSENELEPGSVTPQPEPDQRQHYYDFILQYMANLDDDNFASFLELINAVVQDTSKLQLLASMANESSKSQ